MCGFIATNKSAQELKVLTISTDEGGLLLAEESKIKGYMKTLGKLLLCNANALCEGRHAVCSLQS